MTMMIKRKSELNLYCIDISYLELGSLFLRDVKSGGNDPQDRRYSEL